ncbi:hypothetical protein KSP40_PGU022155 [Platanthera guangdongensis]|uniref:Transcription initiation factor TFIID subunit 8 n=1 Tax=Platanthera guangdongensis TaxID=2320717 RepID=A0ABR2ME51_9ASPA
MASSVSALALTCVCKMNASEAVRCVILLELGVRIYGFPRIIKFLRCGWPEFLIFSIIIGKNESKVGLTKGFYFPYLGGNLVSDPVDFLSPKTFLIPLLPTDVSLNMNDGGKQDGADSESNTSKQSKKTGWDDFGRAVSRIAVAQICEITGFQSSQRSALDALGDIAIRYICSLGKSAHFYANISGRADSNVFDLVQGLEDLAVLRRDLLVLRMSTGAWLVRYSSRYFSVRKYQRGSSLSPVNSKIPSCAFLQAYTQFFSERETPPWKHVPDWLPAFPDPHTYVHTPVWNERTTDRRADKLEQARQRRRKRQRITSAGAAGSAIADNTNDSKGKQATVPNPFILPPVPYDAKQVTSVDIPKYDYSRKRLTVLETFAPAIEAAKTGSLEFGVHERRPLPSKRAPVHFRIGVDKKSIAVPLDQDL